MPWPRVFAGCVLLFCVSFVVRSIDHSVCSRFAFGTQFPWQVLNAAILFLLSRELILETRPRPR